MKIKILFFAAALFTLFFAEAQAQTNERAATRYEGSVELRMSPAKTVWTIDFVKTKAGQQAVFLKFIEQNWAKARQTLKEKGKIKSYRTLSLPPNKTAEWDVLLLTEYADRDSHENRERLFAEAFKTQPTVLINGADSSAMREIKFSRVFTEPITSEIGLAMLETQTADPEAAAVRVPLENYLKGHATGNPEFMRRAFHTRGEMIFIRDGKYQTRTFDEYIAGMKTGKPADDEANRKRWIEKIEVVGNAALGKIILDYPAGKFTDYMTLLKIDGEWKIVNKSFYFEPKTAAAAK